MAQKIRWKKIIGSTLTGRAYLRFKHGWDPKAVLVDLMAELRMIDKVPKDKLPEYKEIAKGRIMGAWSEYRRG